MIKIFLVGIWILAITTVTIQLGRKFYEKGGMERFYLTLAFFFYLITVILVFHEYWIARFS